MFTAAGRHHHRDPDLGDEADRHPAPGHHPRLPGEARPAGGLGDRLLRAPGQRRGPGVCVLVSCEPRGNVSSPTLTSLIPISG